MARREIPRWWLDSMPDRPEQRIPEPEGIEIFSGALRRSAGEYICHESSWQLPRFCSCDTPSLRPVGLHEPEADVLCIVLSDAPVEESDEQKPGVILDYDIQGNVVALEILDASKRMGNPMSVEYAIAR